MTLNWYKENEKDYEGVIYLGQTKGHTPILRSSVPSPFPGRDCQYKVMYIDRTNWRSADIIVRTLFGG